MSGFMKFGGKIYFPISEEMPLEIQTLLNNTEKILIIEKATKISRRGNVITFSGSILRFRFTARFIGIIDNGFIRITHEGQDIVFTYGLSFLWLFWQTFPISVLVPLILSNEITLISALSLFGFIFGITFGINLLFSIISMFLFIKYIYQTVYKNNKIWKFLYLLS